MNRDIEASDLADALESLRAGRLSEKEFRGEYEQNRDASLSKLIWPNLEHYLADADIRERDPAYRTMQDAEMEKLLTLLRTGAPDAELAKIHFLGYS